MYCVVTSADRRHDQYERCKRRECEVFAHHPGRSGATKMLHGKPPHAYFTKRFGLRLTRLAHADDVNCMPAGDSSLGLATYTRILGIETVEHHANPMAGRPLMFGLASSPGRYFYFRYRFYRCRHGSLAQCSLLSGITITVLCPDGANHPPEG